MVLGKRFVIGRGTLLFAHVKNSICLPRMYASTKPTVGCTKKDDDDCVHDHPKPRDPKTIHKTFPFYHLIKLSKDCCDSSCPQQEFAPFDKCLYKESDKNARKYQVTWTECPPLQIKPKKLCCFEKIKKPPIHRRESTDKPNTACKPEKSEIDCEDLNCPKIGMPGCRPVRKSLKCLKERFPSPCEKVKAPYPAFSECVRPKLAKRRRTECTCLDEIPTCEFNRRLVSGPIVLNPCTGQTYYTG